MDKKYERQTKLQTNNKPYQEAAMKTGQLFISLLIGCAFTLIAASQSFASEYTDACAEDGSGYELIGVYDFNADGTDDYLVSLTSINGEYSADDGNPSETSNSGSQVQIWYWDNATGSVGWTAPVLYRWPSPTFNDFDFVDKWTGLYPLGHSDLVCRGITNTYVQNSTYYANNTGSVSNSTFMTIDLNATATYGNGNVTRGAQVLWEYVQDATKQSVIWLMGGPGNSLVYTYKDVKKD